MNDVGQVRSELGVKGDVNFPVSISFSDLYFQNNPTYEYYPSKGGPIGLNILTTTLPANLFPLTWLLPSGMPALGREGRLKDCSDFPVGARRQHLHTGIYIPLLHLSR